MAVSGRVAKEPFSNEVEFHLDYAIDRSGKRWRIYEYHTDYSQTSGGVTKKGQVVRRWDPDAGELEGRPASFKSVKEAIEYTDRWLVCKPKTGSLKTRN